MRNNAYSARRPYATRFGKADKHYGNALNTP